MFAIKNIYLTWLGKYVQTLRLSRVLYDFRRQGGKNIAGIDYATSVSICVFDTDDNSEEWYTLPELFNIMNRYDARVYGVGDPKYTKESPYICTRFIDLRTLVSIDIMVSFGGLGMDGVKKATLQKMVGASFNRNGVLNEIPKAFIKGDTLVFPDNILDLATSELPQGTLLKRVSISENFHFNNTESLRYLSLILMRYVDVVLEVRGDIKVTSNIFRKLLCNIHATGTISVSSIVNIKFSPRFYYGYLYGRVFIFTDERNNTKLALKYGTSNISKNGYGML